VKSISLLDNEKTTAPFECNKETDYNGAIVFTLHNSDVWTNLHRALFGMKMSPLNPAEMGKYRFQSEVKP